MPEELERRGDLVIHVDHEDAVERAWEIVTPVLERPSPLFFYRQGTWGPSQADELIEAAVEMDEAAMAVAVDAAIRETGATGLKDMGKVMKAVMPKVQGRADGSRVSAVVKARLG